MNVIELSVRAQRFLKKVDSHIRERIKSRLRKLEDVAVPRDAKFIGRDEGAMLFRYRIGEYRCLYKYFEKERIVLILKIDKRSRAYDRW